MQSSSARAAHLWVALNSPWGIVTVWLLIVLALQARLASQLLAAASGPMVVWVVIALSALSTATVLLCGARAVLVEIIKPGLANADDFRMFR